MFKGKSAVVRNRRRMTQAVVEALESRQLLSGTEYLVNSLADTVAADNQLTLREAIQAANTHMAVNEAPAGSSSETNIIRFLPSLVANGPAKIVLGGTGLYITGNLSIQGPGSGLLGIDGGRRSVVLDIAKSATVSLAGLAITGGYSYSYGGGVINDGTLRMSNSIVSGNEAPTRGGGLMNDGIMVLCNVTISENEGGGVCDDGALMMSHVTITRNWDDGLYRFSSAPPAMVTNSIVAQNYGSDLAGLLGSGSDYNMFGRLSPSQVASAGAHSLSGTASVPLNPKLGELTSINGQLVCPLLPGSPAINSGSNALALDLDRNPLATDAAGNPRIVGGTVDIGAVERPVGILGRYTALEGTGSVVLVPSGDNSPNLTYVWDLDGDGTFGESGANAAHGDELGHTPTFLVNGLDGPSVAVVSVRVVDGQTLVAEDMTAIDILDVAPTLSISAEGPAQSGSIVVFTLSSSDPGNDTINQWEINWGDGSIQTIDGNPASVSHTYIRGGNYSVSASAYDEDGSYTTRTSVSIIGRLTGRVFRDMDRDGVGDYSEGGLEGCRIYIDANDNGQFDEGERSTLTDASGSYAFDRLSEGTYKLRVIPPAGWRATLGSDGLAAATLVGPDTYGLNFGAAPFGTISGGLFNDLNGIAVRDSKEPGLLGRTVYIDINNNGQLDPDEPSTVSDSTGAYHFDGLLPGSYALRQVLPAGWLCPVDVINVNLASGQDVSGQDFAGSHTPITYVVQSLADVVGADGVLTLREAIEASNTSKAVNEAPAGDDNDVEIIRFDPALFANGPAKLTLGGSELSITGTLEIHGPGAALLSIDANSRSRVLNIASSATVTLEGLSISGGVAPEGYGVIQNDGFHYYGAGVYNAGTLVLNDLAIYGNSASANGRMGSSMVYNIGAGLCNTGTVRMTNATIFDNTCEGQPTETGIGGHVTNWGSGIYNSGTMSMANVTVAQNGASEGIYNAGTLSMVNVTVFGWIAMDNVPGAGSLLATNTIIGNLPGTLSAGSDHNLIGGDPKLGPLTEINGHWVLPLLPGSPAINAGSNALAVDANGSPLLTDAAGQPRIAGGTVDIGAFEYQPQALSISGTDAKDTIELSGDESHFIYTINSDPAIKMPRSLVTALRIDAQGGDELSFDVDLQAADLLIQSDASSRDQLLASLAQSIASARNTTPLWSGQGLRTSSADALHGLAAILNQDAQGKPLYDTFAGQPVDENSILVRYTINGDANLDGKLDASDYFLIDKGFLSKTSSNPLTGYRNGDFNYDGKIDASDYFLIDKAFLATRANNPAASSAAAALAEPSSRARQPAKMMRPAHPQRRLLHLRIPSVRQATRNVRQGR